MGALKDIRREKMIAQGGCCYYCGLPMWDETATTASQRSGNKKPSPRVLRCTAEHLHARSEGGGDTTDNIVAACLYCNNLRHRRKRPLSPEAHRLHVQQRMAAGKWLAAQFAAGSLHKKSTVRARQEGAPPHPGRRDLRTFE